MNILLQDKPRSEQVFDLCMYFTDFADELITLKAILAIGKPDFVHHATFSYHFMHEYSHKNCH